MAQHKSGTDEMENDVDEFADAVEDNVPAGQRSSSSPPVGALDMETTFEHCREALSLFFDNKFLEAKAKLEPWADTSYYHALGIAVFSFLQAILTFEQKDMEVASEFVKKSIELSNQYRRKNTISESFGRILKKPDYNSYTEDQIHAELCYAESLLCKAALTFTEDETLVSFVKGGLKIRSCYQSYKECWNMLINRQWTNDRYKMHFESGVRVGVGSFNLMISLLPQRILKLLEFVGFSGSRTIGLKELEKGYQLKNSVRRVLCGIMLLGYHLIVVYQLSNSEGNLVQASAILEEQLNLNPNGAWFLFYRGRLELVRGNIDDAICWYEKSWHSQDHWVQFHHMCFWELMWAHSMKLNWRTSGEYARRLFEESRWSKCIYAYVQAAMMCMEKEEGNLSEADQRQLSAIMKDVPSYKQRIAGKSLPTEKLMVKKSARFFAQKEWLCLPALELLYAWNTLRIIGKQWDLTQSCYRLVERTLRDLDKRKTDKYYYDNLALATFLKGYCLRWMNSPLQAEECFLAVTKMEKQIVDDMYLVPYSVAELGLLYLSMDKTEQAVEWLEAAKNNYKGYSLESRLHFRVHATLSQIKLANSESSVETPVEQVMGVVDEGLPSPDDIDEKLMTQL